VEPVQGFIGSQGSIGLVQGPPEQDLLNLLNLLNLVNLVR
jgi:hypothetical protein